MAIRKTKWIAAMVSQLLVVCLLVGCKVLPDTDENGGFVHDLAYWAADTVTGVMGENAITNDRGLKGDREFGKDHYVGTYRAEYKNFSGSEILFGGTSIQREEGNSLRVACRLKIENGTAKVTWHSGDEEPAVLLQETGEYFGTIELKGGWESLRVEGNEFIGEVDIQIE